jgi:hypothetical protein
MFKWISWALRIGATAVLLSFLSIWTTGYIVNSYMESVIKQLDLPLDTKPFALSGIWGKLWGADHAPSKTANDEAATAMKEQQQSDTSTNNGFIGEAGQQTDSPTQAVTDTGDESASASPSETTGAIDIGESPSPTPSEQADPGEVQPGEAVPVISGAIDSYQLTDEERQSLYAKVVSKLDGSQLQLLSEALKGGLTVDKLNQLKAMLKAVLTDNEYAQMMEVLQGTKEVP